MPSPDPGNTSELADYEVLVCVCGGISAYKVCHVVSALAQRGAGVTVAMTDAARNFVGTATFQALSGRRVLVDMWSAADIANVQHIERTGQADLVVVAPATANMIGKIACGIADDLVSTMVMSADSPVSLAPAMNDRMWRSPAVRQNVATLRERGVSLVGPAEGWLACRSVGPGRMVEPDEILDAIAEALKASPPKRHRPDTPTP